MLRAHPHFLLVCACNFLSPFFSLSLTSEQGVYALFIGQRESNKKREREKERKRERDKKKKREIERERERCRIWLLNFYF